MCVCVCHVVCMCVCRYGVCVCVCVCVRTCAHDNAYMALGGHLVGTCLLLHSLSLGTELRLSVSDQASTPAETPLWLLGCMIIGMNLSLICTCAGVLLLGMEVNI